jgi:hypothetical protein
MKGINLAVNKFSDFKNEHNTLINKKCIFLSHRRADKEKVERIGDYLTYVGFNIYLDIDDKKMQDAALADDAEEVYSHIQSGLASSDFVLCIISSAAFDERSWWIPYEIGYTDNSKAECCLLKLDGVFGDEIPEFLKIKEVLYNISDLNRKLKEWSPVKLKEWVETFNLRRFGGIQSLSKDHMLTGAVDSNNYLP